MTPEPTELEKHLAREVMSEVVKIAGEKKISKKAAYYLFLGVTPSDQSAFSKREIRMMEEASKKQAGIREPIGRRTK